MGSTSCGNLFQHRSLHILELKNLLTEFSKIRSKAVRPLLILFSEALLEYISYEALLIAEGEKSLLLLLLFIS